MALPNAVILLIAAAAVIVGAGKNAADIVAPVVLALVLTIAVTPLRLGQGMAGRPGRRRAGDACGVRIVSLCAGPGAGRRSSQRPCRLRRQCG
jgi:hypothetical protein